MEICRTNGTLSVRGVRELSAANARLFRNTVCARLAPELKHIEIDLSQTGVVDSCGLGALISISKAANRQNHDGAVALRLLNPQPPVQQVLELTRLHRVFEIVLEDRESPRTVPGEPPSSHSLNPRERNRGWL